jgi:hypothetical protein
MTIHHRGYIARAASAFRLAAHAAEHRARARPFLGGAEARANVMIRESIARADDHGEPTLEWFQTGLTFKSLESIRKSRHPISFGRITN